MQAHRGNVARRQLADLHRESGSVRSHALGQLVDVGLGVTGRHVRKPYEERHWQSRQMLQSPVDRLEAVAPGRVGYDDLAGGRVGCERRGRANRLACDRPDLEEAKAEASQGPRSEQVRINACSQPDGAAHLEAAQAGGDALGRIHVAEQRNQARATR